MKLNESSPPHRSIWAYGYVLVPPVERHRVGPLQAALDNGNQKARLGAHTWEARLINGDDITHILVVSDRPEQDLDANQLLEVELNRLDAPFEITHAVQIGDRPVPDSPPDPTGELGA